MNSENNEEFNGFGFSKPAIYQIKVQGTLDASWSSRLGDMHISTIKKPGGKTISVLVGRVLDQSELSGILNSLYELHLTVISVKALKKIEGGD